MSSPENEEVQIQLPEIIDFIDFDELLGYLDNSQVDALTDAIKRKKNSDFKKTLEPLPEFANNEFKIFDDREVNKLSDKIISIRRRRYIAFVYYYSHFDRTDDQMIGFIKEICNPNMSFVQAKRDLNKIKDILNGLSKTRKELIRYQVVEMHKRAYQKADANNNPRSMVEAANGISKAANLDKDDKGIPWDEILSPAWEPTGDIEVLEGFEKRQNLEKDIARMKRKYDDDAEIVD